MARSFNGSSDFIAVGTDNITVPVSFSAWIYPTSFAANQSIIASTTTAVGYDFQTQITSGHIAITKNASALIAASTGTVTLNTWSQVGFTYDGTNWAAYINGAPSGSGSNSVAMTAPATYNIGKDSGGSGQFWPGRLADIAKWSVILTSLEMAGLGNGIRPGRVRRSSLVRWWPIDGIKNPEPEYSGNADIGTCTGTLIAAGPPFAPFTPRWAPQIGWTPMLPAAGLGWIINRRNKLMK